MVLLVVVGSSLGMELGRCIVVIMMMMIIIILFIIIITISMIIMRKMIIQVDDANYCLKLIKFPGAGCMTHRWPKITMSGRPEKTIATTDLIFIIRSISLIELESLN